MIKITNEGYIIYYKDNVYNFLSSKTYEEKQKLANEYLKELIQKDEENEKKLSVVEEAILNSATNLEYLVALKEAEMEV